ncbi:MAG: PAS domain-containing protein [Bacillota bacterium]
MKTYTWIGAALILLLVVSVLLLVNEFYMAPQRINDLARFSDQLTKCYQISLNVERLVSSAENYMLYNNHRYLDDFRRYSLETLREELDLYNTADSSTKRKIADLIEENRKYLSFVEKEVVRPELENNHYNASLRLEHEDLAASLRNKARIAVSAIRNKVDRISTSVMAGEKRKKLLLFLLSFLPITLLVIGSCGVAIPMFVQNSHLKSLTANLRSAVIITDQRGVVRKINTAAEKLLNINSGTVLNKSLNEILGHFPPLQSVLQPFFEVILHKKQLTNYQTVYTYGGRKIFLTIDYYPLFVLDKLTGAVMVALPEESQKDKSLLFDSIEGERKKLSIEIHDWIGRYMSTMIHSLDYVLRQNGEGLPEPVRENMVRLRNQCQNAAMDMRSIMNEIHPYLIDKVGLIPAVESYVSYFETTHGIKVYLYYSDRTLTLNRREAIVIYRIIQEALTNVAKHSEATEVDIYFSLQNEVLRIEILDNGRPQTELAEGTGLWGMKDRANLLGGDLVYGYTDAGFAVTLTVPLIREGGSGEPN